MAIDYTLIGKRIKARRICVGMTQEQAAEEVNITPVYLSKIENGRVSPTLDTLSRICQVLDIELGYIISGCQCESDHYGNDAVLELFHTCAPEIKPVALRILKELSQLNRTDH